LKGSSRILSCALPVLLGVILLTYFRPVLLGGQSLYQRDLYSFHYPLWKFTADRFAEEGLVRWNPLNNFGQNASGNPNYLTCYPPAWLRFVLDPLTALNWFIVLHLYLGGLCFWRLCRRWKLSPLVSLVGGLLYPFTGVSLSLCCILNLVPYLFLAPLFLWMLEAQLAEPGPAGTIRLGLAAALLVTVAEPIILFGLLAIAVAWVSAGSWRETPASLGRRALAMLLALLLALGVAAPVLWEEIRLLGATPRAAQNLQDVRNYSLHPLQVHGFWIPNPFGLDFSLRGSAGNPHLPQGRIPYLYSIFVGFGAAIFIVVALWPPRRRLAVASACAAGLFSLAALGPYFPPLHWLMRLLPVLKWARYSEKFLFFAAGALLVVLLSGLERLLDKPESAPRRRLAQGATILAAVATILAAGWRIQGSSLKSLGPVSLVAAAACGLACWLRTLGRGRPEWLAGLAGLALLGDLLGGNAFTVPHTSRALFTEQVPVLAKIAGDAGGTPRRIWADPPPPVLTFRGRTDSDAWIGYYYRIAGYPYNGFTEGAAYAYNEVFDQMEDAGLAEMQRDFQRLPLDRKILLLERSAVGYLISARRHSHPRLLEVASFPTNGGVRSYLYRLPGSVPRLSWSEDFELSFDEQGKIGQLLAVPPSRPILTPAGSTRYPPASTEPWSGETVCLFSFRCDRIGGQVKCRRPGLLTLRDARDDSWRAYVNGREVPIQPVDFIFRGILLPPGQHRVEWVYDPPGLRLWQAVSWGCLAGAGLVLLLPWWRRRNSGNQRRTGGERLN